MFFRFSLSSLTVNQQPFIQTFKKYTENLHIISFVLIFSASLSEFKTTSRRLRFQISIPSAMESKSQQKSAKRQPSQTDHCVRNFKIICFYFDKKKVSVMTVSYIYSWRTAIKPQENIAINYIYKKYMNWYISDLEYNKSR